jgi:hypothetical protein
MRLLPITGMVVLLTDGENPAELAETILQKTGWLNVDEGQG